MPAFLAAVAPVVAGGCASTDDDSYQPQAEESVREGINKGFLDPELDVERYMGIFETESREIFTSRDAIVAALELSPGMSVADVGAGTGLFLEPLSNEVGDEGRVWAVEISPKFLEHLRGRVKDEGHENVSVVQCAENSVELPAASADVVFVCDTYHHFEYPNSTLGSIRHALRSGGRLVVVDFERIPGVTRQWLLDHVRAGKEVFRAEIEAAGFELEAELDVEGLEENYVLVFRRP